MRTGTERRATDQEQSCASRVHDLPGRSRVLRKHILFGCFVGDLHPDPDGRLAEGRVVSRLKDQLPDPIGQLTLEELLDLLADDQGIEIGILVGPQDFHDPPEWREGGLNLRLGWATSLGDMVGDLEEAPHALLEIASFLGR